MQKDDKKEPPGKSLEQRNHGEYYHRKTISPLAGKNKLFNRIAMICSAGAMFVAAIGLLGWIPSLSFLGNISPHFIPMSPTASICFILLGLIVLIQIRYQLRGWSKFSAVAVTLVLSVFGIIELAEQFTGIGCIEDFFIPSAGMLGLMRKARMSPATGATFFLGGIATLFILLGRTKTQQVTRSCSWAGVVGSLVTITGVTILMCYLYGNPLLYGGATIPMAATTAIGFIFLGVGLVTAAGPNHMPVRLLVGRSSRAKLLRVFLPLSILIVISQDILYRFVFVSDHINSALLSVLLLMIFVVVTGIIVTVMSGVIGRALDTAEQEIKALSKFPSENPNPVLRIRKDGEVLYTNEAGKPLLAEWESEVGKQVPEQWFNLIAKAFASQQSAAEEEKVGDKLFSIIITPVEEAGYANLYARDITEHKQAEVERTQSELKFRTLYESSSNAVMLLDETGFFDCNEATVKMFACHDKEEFCSKHPADLSPPNQPCGTDSMALANERIATAMKEGRNYFEWVHQTIDGVEFFAEVLLNTLELDGKMFLQAVVRDITASKQTEEKIRQQQQNLEAMFDAAPVGMLLIDEDMVIKQVNDVAAKLVGKEIGEMIDTQPGDGLGCMHSRDDGHGCGYGPACLQCPFRNTVEDTLKTGEPTHCDEILATFLIAGKEVSFWLEISVEPMSLDGKRHVIVVVNNISNRKKAEQQLAEYVVELKRAKETALSMMEDAETSRQQTEAARGELEAVNGHLEVAIERAQEMAQEATVANQAKSEFLANMSHEIRTPMNAIIGFSDLLANDELTDDQMDYVNTIRDSGSNLLTIINDILDFSKIESGKLDTEIIECSLEKLLSNVSSMLRPKATEKGLAFKVLHKTELPANIRTDPTRVHQCLTNLVNNAIKFTENGHVYVLVSLEDIENRPHIRFDVEDTGIGIPTDKQDTIFESFSQVDGSTTRKFGGTGLGLSITKRLAEIMGGSLTVESEPGQGSVFSLVIPAGLDVEAQPLLGEARIKEYTQEPPEIMEEKYSGNILVAEDNPSNQKLIEILLGRMGLKVRLVDDGKQAVDAATAQSFDLIFMDMQMPVMNGYEATELLRQKGMTIPIVALTANALKYDKQECLDAGCDAYLAKPVERRKLSKVLKRYLSSNDNVVARTGEPQENDAHGDEPGPNASQSRERTNSMIDWRVLTDICADEDIITEITTAFCQDTAQCMGKLLAAVREKDSVSLELYAHRIKGGAATIGAVSVAETMTQLEQAGKNEDLATAQALIEEVQADLDSLLAFLAQPDWMEKAKR